VYEPLASYSRQEKFLVEVSEKYNLIVSFLQGYNKSTREFLSFLIEGMIPKL
jgi:hypothetical protein